MAAVDAEAGEPALDELVGTVVGGRFQIVDRIARGGMASVYFATQLPLNRPVAIKVLRLVKSGDAESDESFRRRFLQEASILAQLQHPNIVTLLDYGQISNMPGEYYFMAMEYLAGETLAQRFRARGRLSLEECFRLARQIGRGLREAHRRGFVHRDLKPSNIILVPEDDKNDIVKLVDFGIGKIISARPELRTQDPEELTRVGLLLGSPRHMAPEQIRCEPIELRTDLYGLGVILFQALTGRLPFDGRTEVDVLMAHCSVPPPSLSDVCPGVFFPESLAQLVRSLLHKQPSGRPTIEQFLQRLGSIEEEVFGTISLAGPTLLGLHSRELHGPLLSPLAPRELESNSTAATQPERRLTVPTTPPGSLPPIAYPVPKRQRGLLALLLAILALAGVALLTVFQLGKDRGAALSATRAATGTPVEVQSFVLTIDSSPRGALVSEGGAPLGVTPLSLSVERERVQQAPRRFVITLAGYVPYTIEQGDSLERVSHNVALTVDQRAARPEEAGSTPASDSGRRKRAERMNLDIRPRR